MNIEFECVVVGECDLTDDVFRCKNGECIDAAFRCNNRFECLDNSDEMDCGTCQTRYGAPKDLIS